MYSFLDIRIWLMNMKTITIYNAVLDRQLVQLTNEKGSLQTALQTASEVGLCSSDWYRKLPL